MHNHESEEDGIEPWERTIESSDQTPAEGEVKVGGVVDLSGVLEPTVDHERVTRLGPDDFGVLDSLPWELWECLSIDSHSTLFSAEHVLL